MIQSYIDERLPFIEQRLSELVPETSNVHYLLYLAARYSLLGGGKRIRPLLTLATAESLGAEWKKALSPACALELIHTYSMIHDDLPCMDNDDFRRGKPSLHKQYDEGTATLAGDFLLTHAFQVLAKDEQLQAEQKIQLIATFAENAGGDGMIGGQILDIRAEKEKPDLDALKNIHLMKTGKLIAAAVVSGAIVACVDKNIQYNLKQFGEELGLAFQIIDDVIDVTDSKKKHGKSISSDQINGKTTYATLLGVERAMKLAQEHLENSKSILKKCHLENSILHYFSELLVMRKI